VAPLVLLPVGRATLIEIKAHRLRVALKMERGATRQAVE